MTDKPTDEELTWERYVYANQHGKDELYKQALKEVRELRSNIKTHDTHWKQQVDIQQELIEELRSKLKAATDFGQVEAGEANCLREQMEKDIEENNELRSRMEQTCLKCKAKYYADSHEYPCPWCENGKKERLIEELRSQLQAARDQLGLRPDADIAQDIAKRMGELYDSQIEVEKLRSIREQDFRKYNDVCLQWCEAMAQMLIYQQKVEELRGENERLKADTQQLGGHVHASLDDYHNEKEKADRYRKALGVYANEINWTVKGIGGTLRDVFWQTANGYEIAQKALKDK